MYVSAAHSRRAAVPIRRRASHIRVISSGDSAEINGGQSAAPQSPDPTARYSRPYTSASRCARLDSSNKSFASAISASSLESAPSAHRNASKSRRSSSDSTPTRGQPITVCRPLSCGGIEMPRSRTSCSPLKYASRSSKAYRSRIMSARNMLTSASSSSDNVSNGSSGIETVTAAPPPCLCRATSAASPTPRSS